MTGIIHFSLISVASAFVHPSNDKLSSLSGPWHLFEKPPQKNSDTVDENVKAKDDDIPSWLRPLLRREQGGNDEPNGYTDENLFDSFPFSIGSKERKTNIWESEMSPLVASLSGMINVEALMAAANLTTDIIEVDGNVGSMFPSLDFSDAVNETDNSKGLDTANIDSVGDIESVLNELAAQNDTDVFRDALSFLDGSLRWEKFMQQIQKKQDPKNLEVGNAKNNVMNAEAEKLLDMRMILQEAEQMQSQEQNSQDVLKKENLAGNNTVDADRILREATRRLELAMNSASSTFSPSAIQDLVLRATKTLANTGSSGKAAAKIVFDGARKAPRATAKYTAELIEFANATLAGGIKPLFNNYASVKSVPSREWRQTIKKAAEYSTLSGAIYENTIAITHEIEHTIVAQGKTADIGWMITDSVQQRRDFDWNHEDQPLMVRSFIIRGYDASDDEVDREGLLNTICTAAPVSLGNSTIHVHEGMLEIAESLYQELESYIDLTAPSHKLVFAGHSIGGSLSVLLMALLSQRKSSSFVRERVLRAFTFGSPPTFTIEVAKKDNASVDSCTILEALKLPSDIVYGYAQPWDPIPRLFTNWDPLYPLIDDLGEDGATLYASGPSRTLRPITKAILESWEGWPRFRETARNKLGQNYRSVGKQFLLIPEPTRYLTDRLVSVNTAVPSINSVLQVSSQELLPALNEVFSLDTFSISIIPVAIRSFVHHFYPAYGFPLVDFAAKSDPERVNASNEDESNPPSKREQF